MESTTSKLLCMATVMLLVGCKASQPREPAAPSPPPIKAVKATSTTRPDAVRPQSELTLRDLDAKAARIAQKAALARVNKQTQAVYETGVGMLAQGKLRQARRYFDEVIRLGSGQGASPAAAHSAGAARTKPELPHAVNYEKYRICPGDQIYIAVWGSPEMSAEVEVRPDGMVSFQYAGEVVAAGKTFSELSDVISARLAKYVKDPRTTIQARRLVGNTLTVMGAVVRSGRFQVNRDTRLLDVLAEAGGVLSYEAQRGPSGGANLRDAYLVRGNRKIPVNFYALVMQGDTTQNIPMLPGDLVYIPTMRETRTQTVAVLGAVRQPGRIRLLPKMRVLDVIAEAGGLFIGSADVTSLYAAGLDRAFLSRGGVIMPVDFSLLILHGDMNQNILVQDGDFIYIPTSEENLVFVLGEVNIPRSVNYGTRMTFARAVSSAGGLTLKGKRGAVYLVRGDLKGKPKVERLNAFDILEGRAPDVPLKPFDIVYVSPTVLTETNNIITQVFPGLEAALDIKQLRGGL